MRYQQANYINPLAIFLGPFVQVSPAFPTGSTLPPTSQNHRPLGPNPPVPADAPNSQLTAPPPLLSSYPHLPVSPQVPVFISFFIALREMTILPVPSMQSGGLAWFPDLTAPDPFYILPLAVTGSSLLMVQVRGRVSQLP